MLPSAILAEFARAGAEQSLEHDSCGDEHVNLQEFNSLSYNLPGENAIKQLQSAVQRNNSQQAQQNFQKISPRGNVTNDEFILLKLEQRALNQQKKKMLQPFKQQTRGKVAGDGLRNLVLTPPETVVNALTDKREAFSNENSLNRKMQNSGSGNLVSFANTLKKGKEVRFTPVQKVADQDKYRDQLNNDLYDEDFSQTDRQKRKTPAQRQLFKNSLSNRQHEKKRYDQTEGRIYEQKEYLRQGLVAASFTPSSQKRSRSKSRQRLDSARKQETPTSKRMPMMSKTSQGPRVSNAFSRPIDQRSKTNVSINNSAIRSGVCTKKNAVIQEETLGSSSPARNKIKIPKLPLHSYVEATLSIGDSGPNSARSQTSRGGRTGSKEFSRKSYKKKKVSKLLAEGLPTELFGSAKNNEPVIVLNQEDLPMLTKGKERRNKTTHATKNNALHFAPDICLSSRPRKQQAAVNIKKPNGMKTIQVLPETSNIVLPSSSARAADTKQLFKKQGDEYALSGVLASDGSDYQCTDLKRAPYIRRLSSQQANDSSCKTVNEAKQSPPFVKGSPRNEIENSRQSYSFESLAGGRKIQLKPLNLNLKHQAKSLVTTAKDQRPSNWVAAAQSYRDASIFTHKKIKHQQRGSLYGSKVDQHSESTGSMKQPGKSALRRSKNQALTPLQHEVNGSVEALNSNHRRMKDCYDKGMPVPKNHKKQKDLISGLGASGLLLRPDTIGNSGEANAIAMQTIQKIKNALISLDSSTDNYKNY